MKIKSITLISLSIIFTVNSLWSQHAAIRGKITDVANHDPIPFANILLLDRDSVYVSGVNGNPEGIFEISNIRAGNYLLSVSYLGYESTMVQLLHGNSDSYNEISLVRSAISLNEVAINAHSVIVRSDRKLIIPSQEQVRTSTDGMDMVRKLQLPRIMVDPVSNEITMSGNGEVQLRINGIQASATEIASLDPQDIIRIEYYDDPGARYGNAAAVIDYITRRRNSGGNITASFMNNIGGKKISANDMLSLKFNHGKSEFSVNAGYVQRKQHWTREYDEKFIFPDHMLHRVEIGEPTLFDKRVFNTTLNYSLMEKGHYFFNAQLRYTLNDFPSAFEDRKSKIFTEGSDIPLSIFDHTTEKSHTPALDLYYQYHLKNDQLLIFNIVGTYIHTDNTRIYRETREDIPVTDILSSITGKKYSLIFEGIYEKGLRIGKITGGIKHLQAKTGNIYSGTVSARIALSQAETAVYAEYQAKTGKWSYMVNLTGIRIHYNQDSRNFGKYGIQPAARITFEPVKDLYFRYRVNLTHHTPSLAYLNDVEQVIDPMQLRRGNPELNTFRTLTQSFTAEYRKKIWGINLTLGYDHEFSPIMESVIYEDGIFVHIYENQKSFRDLSAELTFRVKPWKDHISLSVTPRMNYYISAGNDYYHTYLMPEFRATFDLSYKWFIFNVNTVTPYRRLYGEQLTKSQQMYTIMAGYKAAKWSVMIGGLSPFTKNYKTVNENWSVLNPVKSEIHTTHMTRSFLVKLNLNLNYGSQLKNSHKRTNNTDTDSGIMQGVKN